MRIFKHPKAFELESLKNCISSNLRVLHMPV